MPVKFRQTIVRFWFFLIYLITTVLKNYLGKSDAKHFFKLRTDFGNETDVEKESSVKNNIPTQSLFFVKTSILSSINPSYDKRLLLELQDQYATCFLHQIVLWSNTIWLFTFPYCLKSQNKMVPLFLKNKKEEVIIFYVEVQTNVKFRNSVNLDKKFHKN